MQIQILKPSSNGRHYVNYNELIRNARDEDERKYLEECRDREDEYVAKGYDVFSGFAFGIVYTAKMACGHYELFQHPIYRDYGKEPTEENILDSIEDVLKTIRFNKKENRKCTSCICNWR